MWPPQRVMSQPTENKRPLSQNTRIKNIIFMTGLNSGPGTGDRQRPR